MTIYLIRALCAALLHELFGHSMQCKETGPGQLTLFHNIWIQFHWLPLLATSFLSYLARSREFPSPLKAGTWRWPTAWASPNSKGPKARGPQGVWVSPGYCQPVLAWPRHLVRPTVDAWPVICHIWILLNWDLLLLAPWPFGLNLSL